MKLGRNDPCHCGSGKKYKHCHLEADERRERSENSLTRTPDWMGFHSLRMRTTMRTPALALEPVKKAIEGICGEMPEMPFVDRMIEDYCLYDLLVDGRPLVTRVTFPEKDPRLVQLQYCVAQSYPSLIEVIESKRGRGVRLRDRLTGFERFVADPYLSFRLEAMEVFYGRMTAFEGKNVLLDGWIKVPFRARKAMIKEMLDAMEQANLPAIPVVEPVKKVVKLESENDENETENEISAEEAAAEEKKANEKEIEDQKARISRALWLKQNAAVLINCIRAHK